MEVGVMLEEEYLQQLSKFEEQKKNNRRLWNISSNLATILYSLIISNSPKRILEIGTSNGYSTFWMSLAAEKVDATIDSIEVEETRFSMAKNNLSNRNNIFLHFGKAEDLIPNLNGTFDFVFIDAGKIHYIDYLQSLLKNNKLSDGAVLVADNITSHSHTVFKYVEFLKKSDEFISMEIPIDSGFLVSKYTKKR